MTSCVASMRSEYWPAPRHVDELTWHGVEPPSANRGSKTLEAPGAIGGRTRFVKRLQSLGPPRAGDIGEIDEPSRELGHRDLEEGHRTAGTEADAPGLDARSRTDDDRREQLPDEEGARLDLGAVLRMDFLEAIAAVQDDFHAAIGNDRLGPEPPAIPFEPPQAFDVRREDRRRVHDRVAHPRILGP